MHQCANHPPPDHYGRAFLIGILLNISFVIVEGIFGFATDSLALLADAGHNLSDVLGLLIAWADTYWQNYLRLPDTLLDAWCDHSGSSFQWHPLDDRGFGNLLGSFPSA